MEQLMSAVQEPAIMKWGLYYNMEKKKLIFFINLQWYDVKKNWICGIKLVPQNKVTLLGDKSHLLESNADHKHEGLECHH